MNLRRAIVALAMVLMVLPVEGMAQEARTWRIGYLSLGSDAPYHRAWLAAFRQGLRTLGYEEGRNLVIEERYAAGRVDELPRLADALVRSKVDLIVAAPAGSAAAARTATGTIPIVFIGEPDPVGTKLVASLGRPGANVTGLADAHADLVPKRLELLKQVVPSSAKVGVVFNPGNPATASQLAVAERAAKALQLSVVAMGVKGVRPVDVDEAFATIDKERPGSLLVVGDSTLGAQLDRIAGLATKQRIPTMGSHGRWADGGLLMSYGTDFTDQFRRSAVLVDRILKGAKPADLPVEQPTKFELVVNAKAAKALGVTIPPSVFSRADRIIE